MSEIRHWGQTTTKENTKLTCPNKACNKVFTKPLKTINLQQDPKIPYNACPNCLTEVAVVETESSQPETIADCKHHFGYLNEKELKYQIPDECLTCTELIKCMTPK